MNIKTKTLLTLAILAVVDLVIPIPLTGLLLIYVVLGRPSWFTKLVREIYNSN